MSALIVINALAILVGTFVVGLNAPLRHLLNAPLRHLLPVGFGEYLVLLLVGRLIALAAIWRLRLWGLYAFLLFELIELSGGLFVFTPVLTFPARLAGLAAFLVLLSIWLIVLRSKWRLFT